jgi:hypothetical protein
MTNSNLKDINRRQDGHAFSYYGDNRRSAQMVNDITQATKTFTVTGELVSVSAGAAGTTGTFALTYRPVANALGTFLGSLEDTSFAIATGDAIDTEVRFNDKLTDAENLAALDNGEFCIKYEQGVVLYKKATANTAMTFNYKYASQVLDASGATLEVNLDAADDEVSVYGVYNATEPSLSDGDLAQLQLNDKGQLKVTGGASSVTANYTSPANFTATYTSSTTLTLSALSGFSITDSSQLVYIKVIPASGDAAIYVNGSDGVTMTVSSNVVTIAGAGTPFASGDLYEVGINALPFEKDPSTQSIKTSSLTNVWNQYTDAEELVDAQDLTDSYADFGAEIDMRGFTHLSVYIITDVNSSENVTLKLLGKHTSAGTDEYELNGGTTQALWTTGASDSKLHYEFDVKGTPFIQLQAIAGTVGGTAGDLSISITKCFKGI